MAYRCKQTDQEPFIVALKDAIAASRDGHTVPLESQVRMSKSNGAAERAVRTLSAQVRIINGYMDTTFGERIGDDHPLMAWAVTWAGDLLNRYHVGRKGKTAYENMMGRPWRYPIVPFEEKR